MTTPAPPSHLDRVQESRNAIRDAIGGARDVTFVRGAGNLGDELIWAGARSLLADLGLGAREIAVEDLGHARGELGLITGNGALCRPYNEWMPDALAIAELRFDRVIMLPCTADVGEDRVRAALRRTNATVFAREPVTLRSIQGLCDSRLALDTAFFFDYSQFERESPSGTLNAMRTDPERRRASELATDNRDISATAGSLTEFLTAIASAAHVRTDRAHVAIAAALMGRTVELGSSSYFKVDAIADWALDGFPVTRLPAKADPTPAAPAMPTPRAVFEDISAVIATRDRPEAALSAARSALVAGARQVIMVDRNSDPGNRCQLGRGADGTAIRVLGGDRDLGRAAARMAGLAACDSAYALLLDDTVELEPDALGRLHQALEARREAAGASAAVTDAAGAIEQSGADWAPLSATLMRSAVLSQLPFEPVVEGFEDEEWALRAVGDRLRPVSVSGAHAIRKVVEAPEYAYPFAERLRRLRLARSLAVVRDRHGVILDRIHTLFPELEADDGRAAILLDLVRDRGVHAVAVAWLGGELAPLLAEWP